MGRVPNHEVNPTCDGYPHNECSQPEQRAELSFPNAEVYLLKLLMQVMTLIVDERFLLFQECIRPLTCTAKR
jgi:hypothetical protein